MSFHLVKINPHSSPLQFPHFPAVLEEWTCAHAPVTHQLCCGAQLSWKLEAHWVHLLAVHSWSEHFAFSWQHNVASEVPTPLPCPEAPGTSLPMDSMQPCLVCLQESVQGEFGAEGRWLSSLGDSGYPAQHIHGCS